uniref:Uncharacterized protein n=1 Tax=Rhizophagus irregularis (strain DAOM 181602 / DAOM 197198 / MUCL 43194) TaxID=747089 RepID=U9SPD2_RHIID
MIAITNKYEFSGINKDFISYIHSRLELISNDDSDFIEAIDSGNPRERISAIDDKILERRLMRNTEYKYKVTNVKSGDLFFEFEGTRLDFAKFYTAENDSIVDVGYPDDIIADYRNGIINDQFDEDRIPAVEAIIERLNAFDKDDVVIIGSGYESALITNSLDDIDQDFRIDEKSLKNLSVLSIESLGYTIEATSQRDGWSRLYLVEDGNRVGQVDFRSNNESIENVRAKLRGDKEFNQNSYLAVGIETLYATSLAHSMAHDRISPEKITALVNSLPSYAKKEYENKLDGMGGKAESVVIPEAEHFYLIHAKQFSRGEPVLFTNEFVGTERAFKEYLDDYKPQVLKIELFQPEFVKPHREIEKIIVAYKNHTGNKEQMLETVKGFDEKALVRLEDRLKDEGIDQKKFENDLNGKQSNKLKMCYAHQKKINPKERYIMNKDTEKDEIVKDIESMGAYLVVKNGRFDNLSILIISKDDDLIGSVKTPSKMKEAYNGNKYRKFDYRRVEDVKDILEGKSQLTDSPIDHSLSLALKEARSILLAYSYKNKTLPMDKIKEIGSKFDDRSIFYLEDRLRSKNISTDDFQRDINKTKQSNKLKI